MIELLTELVAGNPDIARQMESTKAFWDDFFEVHRNDSVATLATALSQEQSSYELLFDGDRSLAKNTMPFTCLAAIYDKYKGFDRNQALAVTVAKAFLASMTSVEVKGAARRAIETFYLYDDPELKEVVRRNHRALLE